MLRGDFHTHTCYCDGADTPRAMVEAAYQMGFTDFGVSGHADASACGDPYGMDAENLRRYREELFALREEYRGRMNIYIGLELDCLGACPEAEYTIGSTHYVQKNGEFLPVDDTAERLADGAERLFGGDWYALAEAYFETEAKVYERTRCSFVGHFDLLTKFNEKNRFFDETCDAYFEPALCAMKALHREGLPFEINTGAMSRGCRSCPYPSKRLLKELCQMGGNILINSDSHSAKTIGYAFSDAVRLAKECGFTHSLMLCPGGGFRRAEL